MVHRLSALAALLLSLAACGGEEKTCGEGTVRQGDACVPAAAALTCGEGTIRQGDACVPTAAALTCGEGTVLSDGQCIVSEAPPACVPSCGARVCGDDGCGGSCGTCSDPAKPVCDTNLGKCVVQCVPDCGGKSCGGDGCGGTCGTCQDGLTCRSSGRCVPGAWTCDAAWYGAGDACDCDCGAVDTDCAAAGAPLAGCEENEECSTDGKCVSSVPSAWTCTPSAYDALDACNCGCGAPDPDCAHDQLALLGCNDGVTECNADGTCGTCTLNCTGKQCGSDGCGGACGTCGPALSACRLGTCVDPCKPLPLRCEWAVCGYDGCSDSCGTCALGYTCSDGQCLRDPSSVDPASCVGRCGSQAPAGCYCTDGCTEHGLCCQDYKAACSCTPNCAGKECGDDKCNGSCGVCTDSVKKYCGADGKCTDACTPKCGGKACGDNGCGGVCATCPSGLSCTYFGKCLPDAWKCDPFLYGDSQGCDCGCGAPDPDCAVSDASVFNCPTSQTECKADGLCDAALCDADTSCGAGQWCTGVYYAGSAKFAGACEAPLASASPVGFTCEIDEECASLVCLDEHCRRYCQRDAECPEAQICVGLPVSDPITGALRGTAPVCHGLGSGAACTSQASCTVSGERCTAVVDPVTRGPRYVCALVLASAVGQSCLANPCPDGYLCATMGTARRCTLPCPGGGPDCPSGFQCGTVNFTLAGTSTPPSIPACVPN